MTKQPDMIQVTDEEAADMLRATSKAILARVKLGEPIGEDLLAAALGIMLETLATVVERLGDL